MFVHRPVIVADELVWIARVAGEQYIFLAKVEKKGKCKGFMGIAGDCSTSLMAGSSLILY